MLNSIIEITKWNLVCYSYQGNTTQAVLDTIMSVQPKEAGAGAGESREAVVSRQAREMLKRLPPMYDQFVVKQRCV